MKKLFFTFILILAAIFLGFLVHKDPGYLLMAYNGWTLETSIWVALVCEIILFLVLYFIIRLIHNTFDLGERWGNWRKKRKHFKMDEKLEQGVYESFSGEWARAEKKFAKASKLNESKAIAFLGAALSAHQEGEHERCERYLDAAKQADPQAEITVLFARAQWLVQRNEWEAVEPILLELKEKAPKNALLSELLHRLDLHNFIRHLQKANGDELEILWRSLSRDYQRDPQFLRAYIESSLRQHHHAEVVSLIEHILKKDWRPELLKYYAQANAIRRQQLITAEKWLKKHGQDPDLLLCVAKLSLAEKFENKAHDYLKTALNIRPSPEVYQALGNVFAALGNEQKAIKYFQMQNEKVH